MEKILHLNLKKKWFDLIKSGDKKEEYREIKPYWEKRFFEDYLSNKKIKKYDLIYFKNGYNKNSPKIEIEWKGLEIKEIRGKKCFAIKLGKIIK